MIVNADWGAGAVWTTLAWADSSWEPVFRSSARGFFLPELSRSLTSQRRMMWKSQEDNPNLLKWLLVAPVSVDSIGAPDTAMVTTSQDTEEACATSATRTWVVRSEQRKWTNPPDVRFWVRVLYSDTVGIWHEMPQLGIDEDHCAVAPLGEKSAIVVYAGRTGLAYCIAEGDRWVEHGILDSRPWHASHPRFRKRPAGGWWLMWSDKPWVRMSVFHDGKWSRGDSLQAIHPEGQTFIPAWGDMSQDDSERPILVWGDLGYGYTHRDVGVVAFPTDSGWAPGEEIPGSDRMFLTPRVSRDRNGDAWVGWRVRGGVLSRWTHTYVHATCSAPVVGGAGRERRVTWTLSESAPETWWAVLRARNDGPWEEVARVQAGEGLDVSWTDTSPPAGVLRYRIRRESVDARYRWESPGGTWPPKANRRIVLTRSGPDGSGDLALEGAEAGPVEVRIYDIQGRLMRREEQRTNETETVVRLDLSAATRELARGVYFVTVRDKTGTAALPLKFVVLR